MAVVVIYVGGSVVRGI